VTKIKNVKIVFLHLWNKTSHEVGLRLPAEPAQTKSSFIPDKCRLARQLTDETTSPTHPISENSSVNYCLSVFCSDKIERKSTFVPDKSSLARQRPTRRHPIPTPISENSSASSCSRNFELFLFFHVFINTILGHVPLRPPVSYAYGDLRKDILPDHFWNASVAYDVTWEMLAGNTSRRNGHIQDWTLQTTRCACMQGMIQRCVFISVTLL